MLGKSDQLFFAPLVRDCPAAMLGPDRPGEFSFFSFGTLGVSSICVLFPGGSWPCEGSKSALPRDIYTGNVCYTPHLNTRCTPSDRDTWWGVFFFFLQSSRLPLVPASPFCRCQIHCELINSQRKKKPALALSLQRPAVTGVLVHSGVSKGRSLFLCGSGYHAYGAWARCHYPYIG